MFRSRQVRIRKMTGLSVIGFTGWRGRNLPETVRMFFESCECAYQRIRYGFCFRDAWDIDAWFMKIMPGMLAYFRDNRHGSPDILEDGITDSQRLDDDGECHEAWTKELNRMIFLLGEMNENVCSRKNPYEEAYDRCEAEFEKEYGSFGEKLRSVEEIADEKKKGIHVWHTMSELPEYRPIADAFFHEEKSISEYRAGCKDEFFRLFSKYFYGLWE